MRVKLIAPFDIPEKAADGSLEIPEGARVRDVLRRARAPFFTAVLPVSVNGRQVARSYRLKEGDVLILITPISGG